MVPVPPAAMLTSTDKEVQHTLDCLGIDATRPAELAAEKQKGRRSGKADYSGSGKGAEPSGGGGVGD